MKEKALINSLIKSLSKISFLKSLWRMFLTDNCRYTISRVRVALSNDPMVLAPQYADDGLISAHISDFLKDSKFMSSYNIGKANGALTNHPGDIHYRAYIACWAANYALDLEGDFVECGVGKALLSKTIVNYLNFEKVPKRFYLLDTYEGIPVEQAKDKKEMANMATLNKSHFATSYYEEVKQAFIKYPNVELIKGRIPESFGNSKLEKVSYISIDMNNAFAEIAAIDYLWNKLVVGGVVVLDDYAYGPEFMEQKNAWDKFASDHKFTILTLPTGQGLIIKNKN